ncbi:MAG: ATP-binding protein [Bacteroidetes bacterium]|nr:ATP-binding protein [Bacteroidota bacterium]
MFKRVQSFSGLGAKSCFFWGPRQTGKSTLLKQLFPDAPYYDLLLSDMFLRLSIKPSLLREQVLSLPVSKTPVIIDEVQKIPLLLDEAQWLIVNKGVRFILCGSSARKLKRSGANLLGGRALRYEMFPLVYPEIPNFRLNTALNNGLLPVHYQEPEGQAKNLLLAYVTQYLKEEIEQEAISRKIPLFHRFLENAAFSNGEVVNFSNIARECGVSSPTVKEYFKILTDTLLGRFLPAYMKRPKRRVVESPKFYFFDIGIVNYLLNRSNIVPGIEIFGKALEHFIFQEISSHSHYSGKNYPVSYWRTSSGYEVDFISGDPPIAIEVKGTDMIQTHHLKGLKAFKEEYPRAKCIAVSLDSKPRVSGNIQIYPWKIFLELLWNGELI